MTNLSLTSAAALAFLCIAGNAHGQTDSLPDLNSLKSPSSPAFTLLGVAPSEVERPQTPADFAFSLVNQSKALSSFPDNYAAEISPYWILPRPSLSWRADTTRTLGQSFWRTLSLSVATADVGTEAAPAKGLGAGASFYLLSGRMSDESQAQLRAVERALAQRDSIENELIAARTLVLQTRYGDSIARAAARGDTALVRALGIELTAQVAAAREAAKNDPLYRTWFDRTAAQISDAAPQRVGLFWGFSGGAAWEYPNSTWSRGHVRRVGAWTTMSYEGSRFSRAVDFTPVAIVRLLGEHGDSAATTLDAGGRFILSSDSYTASLEGVVRLPIEQDGARNLYRLAGIVEYRVRPDLWLTGTFGRDYRSTREGSLLAQFGVKFNLAQDRYQPASPAPTAAAP